MALINIGKQFEQIKQSSTEAIRSIFPISKKKHKLVLNKVWVEDKADLTNYKEQARSKARGGSWGAGVYASLDLVNLATNKVIDSEAKVRLFLLPKLTPRGSYIVKGNEYQVSNQLRLKSGVYTKTLKNGGFKTQFNMAKGGSAEMHINDKGIIQLKVKSMFIDLYPLLIGMGISDQVIKKAWGSKVFEINREAKLTPKKAVEKLSESLTKKKTASSETAKDNLKSYIENKTEILPEMTKLTLGKEHSRFTPQLWLDASKKLIAVEKRDTSPDDVDNLAYKEFFGIEDALKERIEKNKKSLVWRIERNLDSKEKIRQIINISTFNSLVESFFTSDDRSSTSEQINPLHMYSEHDKVSFLGPGSIQSTQQVTDEMRNVHPTHFSYLDPVHTPESSKIGLNLSLALGVKKDGKVLRSAYWDIKKKKFVDLTAQEVFPEYVAYPDQWDVKSKVLKYKTVKTQYRGKITSVKASQVDLIMPFAQNAFSLSTNLIPFMANDNGNRTMMAGKHMEQAISLKHRETPLVQSKMPVGSNTSFEDAIGSSYSVYATVTGSLNEKGISGKVTEVTKDHITIKGKGPSIKINLYDNFSLNQKTFITQTAIVKVGDIVKEKQLLADSNYTKGGTLSLGTNLKTAYIPYKGYNFEDGIVITDSAATKLTSEHIYKKTLDINDEIVFDLAKYLSNFPNEVNLSNRGKLDVEGIIKKGSKVVMGDVIIAALKKTAGPVGIEVVKARIHKSLGRNFQNKGLTWTKDVEGTVVGITKTAEKITVMIKTEERARIGDKLAGRHGNKGIITKIIPDELAPKNTKGEAVEILLNPHGVISRINIGQMYESAMGKVAKKKGKPYKVTNFTGENYLETVKKELKDAKVDDKEELFDPETGKSLGKVHVGNPYILKLNKQSEVNFSVRGESGPSSRVTLQPIKGGEEGSKSMDMLTMFSLLSHGAKSNLQETSTIKSENNPEFWEALKFGRPLPAPKIPHVFNKFKTMLQGAGVDVKKVGSKFILNPLIDKQVKEMSSMEIKSPTFFQATKGSVKEEKGGFVDRTHLGGVEGKNWAHISLKESVPNPIFEDAIKQLLDMKKESFNALRDGSRKEIIDGKEYTAGQAIEKLLSKINVTEELKSLSAEMPKLRKTALNKATKRFRLLKALQDQKLTPIQAYMRKEIPVVPPVFRPLTVLSSRDIAGDDVNMLYRNVALLTKQMKLPTTDLLPEETLSEIRKELNTNIRGLVGLESVRFSGKDKIGFLEQIKGKDQPKNGFYQNKVLRKNQNLVGRGTIIPEPKLHMDQVGLPEKMAWKLYMPFVIKELISSGMSAKRAKEVIDKKTPHAKMALDRAMSKRPVMLNRAPSLHKFSIMAFQPTITDGKAIKIPPLVVSGFNADFNGDSVARQTLINVIFNDKSSSNPVELCGTMEEIFTQIIGKEVSEMIKDAKGFTAIYNIQLGSVKTRGFVNGKSKLVDIERLTVHTSHGPCYKVKTHTGTEGIFSEHHNFSYIDDNLDMISIKTEDMPSDILIPKVNLELAWKGVNTYQVSSINSNPLLIDEDWSYLLGFFAGDGHVCDRRNTGRGIEVGFTDTEGTMLDYIEKTLIGRGFTPGKRQGTKEHPKCKAMIYNNELGKWLMEHSGVGFAHKKVPSLIFNSPLKVRLAFCYGVIEAEGNICIDKNKKHIIRVEMSNHIFIRQLRILLSTCGINTFLSETFLKDKSHKSWKLNFSKNSWDKLSDMPKAPKSILIKEALYKRLETKKIPRDVYSIVPMTEDVLSQLKLIGNKLQALDKSTKIKVDIWKKEHEGKKISITDHIKNKKGTSRKYVSSRLSKDIIYTYGFFKEDFPAFNKWVEIAQEESILWELITNIDEVEREEVLFDFTVPEGETFCIDNGLITHNTMTVHVPIRDKSVREAYKMMPSQNLWKPGSGSLMVGPSQESQLGFYLLSKTKEGRDKINKILPKKYAIKSTMDKKSSKTLFMNLAKELPNKEFSILIDKIKIMGETASFDKGFTLGISDLGTLKNKNKYLNELENAAIQVVNKKSTLTQFRDKLLGKGGIQERLDTDIKKQLKGSDNAFYDMVNSGARGNYSQLRQIVASPLIVQDPTGNLIPSPIKKSFSEGLDLSDYWIASYGARKGMMDRALSTKDPGAFNKAMMAVTMNNIISMEDCKTKKGIYVDTKSTEPLGRYIQGTQGTIQDETIITEKEIKVLLRKKINKVYVRSPLKCEAPKGTCIHCYGVNENGDTVEIGDNVGAKAGQTLAEPLTQLTMNTFHTGGVAGTGNKGGYTRIKELLNMPKKIKVGKAILSSVKGLITKIESSGLGGSHVYVNDEKHLIPAKSILKVKKGDHVEKGDMLNHGVVSPQELLKYKGMDKVQTYLTDELQQAYNSEGMNINRKTFETIIKSVADRTMVHNNAKGSPWLPGQSAPYSQVMLHNKNLEDGAEKVKHTPYLQGLSLIPQRSEDWLAQMGATHIKDAIIKGASQGWMSETRGYHPIPAYAIGATFGDNDSGKY